MNHATTKPPLSWDQDLAPAGIAAVVLVACVTVLVIFRADVMSALSIWTTSSAYSYCFLILPISLYLIFVRRRELKTVEMAPSYFGILLFTGCLALWWLGMAASVNELRQFAVVGLLQSLVFGLLGRRFYRRILFPMLYLFLMVPSATILLSPLQTITTFLSSKMLQWSGIPTLGENHIIEVPHGLYEVAPGCAGLNFFLSSVALASIFAVVVYRGNIKRFSCVAAALLLSILTNAVRVFGIIWLAEATERRIDIVDDHLLYGWGVYCVVILLAMLVASKFRDLPRQPSPEEGRVRNRGSLPKAWLTAFTMIFLAYGVTAAVAAQTQRMGHPAGVVLNLPSAVGGWQQTGVSATSILESSNSDGLTHVAYAKAGKRIDVEIAYYWKQAGNRKMIDVASDIGGDGKWRVETQAPENLLLGNVPMTFGSFLLSQGRHRRMVWSYDWIGGHHTTNALYARLLGMGAAVGLDGRSAIVILSIDGDDAEAQAMLSDFIKETSTLDRALSTASLRAN